MTAASELKSAAVVQIESRKRKTPSQKATSKTAVKAVEKVEARPGSTTASATTKVASASAEIATSGSTAARHSKAASIQATRLPVSFFSQNSPVFPTIQQNPVALRPVMPERFLRARSAAEQIA
jgi:hypothetical protein